MQVSGSVWLTLEQHKRENDRLKAQHAQVQQELQVLPHQLACSLSCCVDSGQGRRVTCWMCSMSGMCTGTWCLSEGAINWSLLQPQVKQSVLQPFLGSVAQRGSFVTERQLCQDDWKGRSLTLSAELLQDDLHQARGGPTARAPPVVLVAAPGVGCMLGAWSQRSCRGERCIGIIGELHVRHMVPVWRQRLESLLTLKYAKMGIVRSQHYCLGPWL